MPTIGRDRGRCGYRQRTGALRDLPQELGSALIAGDEIVRICVPVVGFFGAYIPSRMFMKGRPELAILLSPALLIVIWTFVISGIVQAGIPLSAALPYFWATTAAASFFGCYIAFRGRHPDDILTIVVARL